MYNSFPTTTITSNSFTNMHELLSCTEEDNNEKAKEEYDCNEMLFCHICIYRSRMLKDMGKAFLISMFYFHAAI